MNEAGVTKTLLISGGSRGIGRATALLAAARGWRVAITYRANAAAADAVVAAIADMGGEALAIQGDTASEADVARAFEQTVARFGGLEAVVVNAGVVAPPLPLAEMSLERLKTVFDTNLLGALLFAREAARRLPSAMRVRAGAGGAVVFVSSAAARLGAAFEYVDYAASKGALDTLTLGLAKELGPQNIRVNGVRPGLIDTEIHASGGQPGRAQRLGAETPLGRAGAAEETAEAILWLCSDQASYAAGAILDVSGGR